MINQIMMHEGEGDACSLRERRKKSSISLSSCFKASNHQRTGSWDATLKSKSPSPSPSPLPEIKDKCRNLISRIARHRRHSSAEFSYDPLSYALNFDHDEPSSDEEIRIKNFTSRLPSSPLGGKATEAPFDHYQPPITPPWELQSTLKPMATGNHELRRGFEALSESMKRTPGE